MDLDVKNIHNIYDSEIVNKYDSYLSHFFKSFKKKAFKESSLNTGDHVLVFCCGTGLDFPLILNKIGTEGRITGVDFSSRMLKSADKKIRKNNWVNIELVHSDVTQFENKLMPKADSGVCTLGFSIIPDYTRAYQNLLSNVKPGGEIIIGDMQLASGWQARLNPVTILLAKRFGGSYEGHKNSLLLYDKMVNDLKELKKREFFFKSYYYCIGRNR
jgi:demethylmenaquinone methyltransferase/2-methoxy-6-polyprenyl-1,4-benzoquinol methylase